MLSVHSRRWFSGAAALAAAFPTLAVTRIQGVPADDDEEAMENSYTSPTSGMNVSWKTPWELDGTMEYLDEYGIDVVRLEPSTSPASSLDLSTILISHDFRSPKAFLDRREATIAASKDARAPYAVDGVHELIHERTETTLTIMLFLNVGIGPVFELYESHAEPDAEFATQSDFIVYPARDFDALFSATQKSVTFNGDALFTTVDHDQVIKLAQDALDRAADNSTSDDEDGPATSYTSPEFGMAITWAAPWELRVTSEDADYGYEGIALDPAGSAGSARLTAATDRISRKHDSAEEYLDHHEAYFNRIGVAPARRTLIHERTETTLTLMAVSTLARGPVLLLDEHHAEPGAEFALTSGLRVDPDEVFEDLFMSAQGVVTVNGDAPFTTVDNDEVIRLANDALRGVYPDDNGS